jgi:DNA-binding response OmpR family regulator
MDDHTATGGRARILIVDDDPHAQEILSHWVRKAGYEAVCAASGQACLEQLALSPVDVIVLDVMMPEMDGLEVCERIRQNRDWRSIPVILLTAKDDMETRARGMDLGVSEYLTKPVNKHELFSRLRAQVRSRELERRLSQTAASIGDGSED